MSIRTLICVECPVGCRLSVEAQDGVVTGVSGNKCPKGAAYGRAEVEAPMRVLTSTVAAEGLAVRMVPVRTDAPIPKDRLMEAMEVIKKTTITKPVAVGEVIIPNLLGTGANVVATRAVP